MLDDLDLHAEYELKCGAAALAMEEAGDIWVDRTDPLYLNMLLYRALRPPSNKTATQKL